MEPCRFLRNVIDKRFNLVRTRLSLKAFYLKYLGNFKKNVLTNMIRSVRLMGKKIEFTIPDEWEDKWQKLLELYHVNDSELVLRLIEDEVRVMTAKHEKEAYERIEKATRMVYEVAGRDGLEFFAKEIELIARKVTEEIGR